MDADNIIWIFVWGAIIIFSIVSSNSAKSKKRQEQQRNQREAYPIQYQQPVHQVPPKPQMPLRPQMYYPQAQQDLYIAPQTIMPQEEGQRVTSSHNAAVQNQSQQASQNPLRDRETLIKALVYGDILKPKF